MQGLDKKNVAFGRVVEGLSEIQKLNIDYSPDTFNISIVNCGKYDL